MKHKQVQSTFNFHVDIKSANQPVKKQTYDNKLQKYITQKSEQQAANKDHIQLSISCSKPHIRSYHRQKQSTVMSQPSLRHNNTVEQLSQINSYNIDIQSQQNELIYQNSMINAHNNINNSLQSSESFFSQPSQSFSSNMNYNKNSNINTIVKMQLQMYEDINENQFEVIQCDNDNKHIPKKYDSQFTNHFTVPIGLGFQVVIPKLISSSKYLKLPETKAKMRNLQKLKVYDPCIDEHFYRKQAIYIYHTFIQQYDSNRPVRQETGKQDYHYIGKYLKQNQIINGSLLYLDINLIKNAYRLYVESINKLPEWQSTIFWNKRKSEVYKQTNYNENMQIYKFREYIKMPTVRQYWKDYFTCILKNRRKRKRNRFPGQYISNQKIKTHYH